MTPAAAEHPAVMLAVDLVFFVIAAAIFGVHLLVVWLVARRRNRIAKWIFVGLTSLGFAVGLSNIEDAFDQDGLVIALVLGSNLLSGAAIWILIRLDSRAWFNGTYSSVDVDIFR